MSASVRGRKRRKAHNPVLQVRPDVVAYADADTIGAYVVEALASRVRFSANSIRIVHFLAQCHQSNRNACRRAAQKTLGLNADAARDLVDLLVNEGHLVPTGEPTGPTHTASIVNTWPRYGWGSAALFFLSIFDYPFLDYLQKRAVQMDIELMKAYVADDPPPAIYKEYSDARFIELRRDLKALHDIDVWDALRQEYATDPVIPLSGSSIANWLSSLLLFSVGQTGKVEFSPQGWFLLKCVPSGGARHPIEAYVVINEMEEIAAGVYHYSVKRHGLEAIREPFSQTELEKAVPAMRQCPWKWRVLVILTARVERTMWRYREPRSYRVVHHDLGHILEMMTLIARTRGIGSFCTHGFHDTTLESLLSINVWDEPALRVVAFG